MSNYNKVVINTKGKSIEEMNKEMLAALRKQGNYPLTTSKCQGLI